MRKKNAECGVLGRGDFFPHLMRKLPSLQMRNFSASSFRRCGTHAEKFRTSFPHVELLRKISAFSFRSCETFAENFRI